MQDEMYVMGPFSFHQVGFISSKKHSTDAHEHRLSVILLHRLIVLAGQVLTFVEEHQLNDEIFLVLLPSRRPQ